MELLLVFGALLSLVGTLATVDASKKNTDKANQVQKELQEDSQEFSAGQQQLQNEWDKQMYEYQLTEGPLMRMQGYKAAGMSDAAAIQAIAGGSSVQMPVASNASSGIASAAQPNTTTSAFQGLTDLVNNYIKNRNTEADTGKKEQDVVFSKKQCEQIDFNMQQDAKRLGIEQDQLQLAKDLNYSQIGLMESERLMNLHKISEINSNVQKNLATIRNLDANTITEYVQQSKLVAETEYIQSSTELNNANVAYVQSQTEGQNIANLDANIVLTLKNARLEISKALGIDVDSDMTTQLLMSMATGRYDTTAKLLEIKNEDTHDPYIGSYTRSKTIMKLGYHSTKSIYKDNNPDFSPSFQPLWNP